jgi:hypothetical protein
MKRSSLEAALALPHRVDVRAAKRFDCRSSTGRRTTMRYEKLGVFYLGQVHDAESLDPTPELLLYDSRDLVTHAVCVGMTGSGKTGLCVGLLEEAAIDSIPAIVIDPKGDLANLLLTFPELRGEDFRPWIQEEQANRKGVTADAYAQQQAEMWRKGLEGSHQDGARIQRLRDAADFSVYTPGSQAGLPVSVLKSFSTPADAVLADADLVRERIGTAASSLLALLGIEADPVRSREHILIANILQDSWSRDEDLDLGRLIRLIQTPQFERIGVMDLESFYPEKDRFALAMRLNNLMAAPGFQAWLEGDPLDVQRILHTAEGKPRVSVFSIAHLSDPERMFFVSLLLNEVLGWMRTQSGTGSLRALVYMDEVAGYLPPTAAPPSKAPLLTLFKQARAFGLGVVLSTQNPVDLDYKALSNAGTWFIGRLQTERDKSRLLDGLESAKAAATLDRRALDDRISSLEKRMFLLHNVHEEQPAIFHTRWVMSYLRGPMTREEIKRLTRDRKTTAQRAEVAAAGAGPTASPLPRARASAARVRAAAADTGQASRPVLPPDVPECFLPLETHSPPGATLLYRPMLYGGATVSYAQTRHDVDHTVRVSMLSEIGEAGARIDWDESISVNPDEARPASEPPEADGRYESPQPAATRAKSYPRWRRGLQTWLYRNRPLELLRCRKLKLSSRPGETEGDFRVRLRELAHQARDAQAEKLRKKYTTRFERLQDRIARAEHKLERQSDQAKNQKAQTAISFGAAILGSFLGRKKLGRSALGRATTAMRGVGRSQTSARSVERARESLETTRTKLADLEAAFEGEVDALTDAFEVDSMELESVSVRAKKKDIDVERLALAWVPYWCDPQGAMQAASEIVD